MPSRAGSSLQPTPTAETWHVSSTAFASGETSGVRVGLLGGFELVVDGGSVSVPVHAQRLIAFLALRGRPLHRAYVAGRLWIELSQEHAHNCLRSTLWRLQGASRGVVDVSTTHLVLSGSAGVDARELEAAARRVLSRTSLAGRDVDLLVAAQDLLVDWYDDWIVDERERLRQLRLLALETACLEMISAERFTEALVVGTAAVADDPLRESATRALIAAQCAAGNVAEALQRYEAYRRRLAEALQLAPSQLMTDLIRSFAPEWV